jgi:hypothetical protein
MVSGRGGGGPWGGDGDVGWGGHVGRRGPSENARNVDLVDLSGGGGPRADAGSCEPWGPRTDISEPKEGVITGHAAGNRSLDRQGWDNPCTDKLLYHGHPAAYRRVYMPRQLDDFLLNI